MMMLFALLVLSNDVSKCFLHFGLHVSDAYFAINEPDSLHSCILS